MPSQDAIVYIKSPVPGIDYLFASCWFVGSHWPPQTLWAIAITLGYPPELGSKEGKVPHSWIRTREIKLLLIWTLHPHRLALIVMEGSMHATREENWSTILPNCEHSNIIPDMIRPMVWQWHQNYWSNPFLVRLKACFTKQNSGMVPKTQLVMPQTLEENLELLVC